MSAYNYKCRECGEYFDEPRCWVEMHGFTWGPGEHWSVCPHCGSCDYDEAYVVEREEAADLEDDDAAWPEVEVARRGVNERV